MLVEAAILDREHRLLMRGGIAASATGRRFSRSPLTSAVRTGASSVSRSLGLRAELEPLRRDRRRAAAAARFAAFARLGAGGRWNTTRTTWPLQLRRRAA